MIVERELEIEAFKSQEYWTVHLDTSKDHQPFTAKLFQYQGKKLEQLSIASQAEYDAIHAKLTDAKLAAQGGARREKGQAALCRRAVHHVHAAAGSGAQARHDRRPHDAHRAIAV